MVFLQSASMFTDRAKKAYMDDEVDLLSGNRIDLEILEHIPSITSEPKAMEVIAELVAKLPEMGDRWCHV